VSSIDIPLLNQHCTSRLLVSARAAESPLYLPFIMLPRLSTSSVLPIGPGTLSGLQPDTALPACTSIPPPKCPQAAVASQCRSGAPYWLQWNQLGRGTVRLTAQLGESRHIPALFAHGLGNNDAHLNLPDALVLAPTEPLCLRYCFDNQSPHRVTRCVHTTQRPHEEPLHAHAIIQTTQGGNNSTEEGLQALSTHRAHHARGAQKWRGQVSLWQHTSYWGGEGEHMQVFQCEWKYSLWTML
jgi:hypothetical protein